MKVYNGLGKALLDFETAVVDAEEKAEGGVRDLHAILGPLEEAKAQYESVWHLANMLQLVTGELANSFSLRSDPFWHHFDTTQESGLSTH